MIQKKFFDFALDKQLSIENREYFFAFSVGSSNDKKKFLSTNNMSSFYSKFITDSIAYIGEKRNEKKSKEWFSKNISQDHDELLKEIKEAFYLEIEQKKFLYDEDIGFLKKPKREISTTINF